MRIWDPEIFSRAQTLEQSIMMLQEFLSDESTEAFIEEEETIFGNRGNWIKSNSHFVANIPKSSIKIEVFSKEEWIPHFRAIIAEYTANYSIHDWTKIIGEMPHSYNKKILVWYRSWNTKKLLIEKWNEKRPDWCQVGEYKEK